jgi:hypothetical protein
LLCVWAKLDNRQNWEQIGHIIGSCSSTQYIEIYFLLCHSYKSVPFFEGGLGVISVHIYGWGSFNRHALCITMKTQITNKIFLVRKLLSTYFFNLSAETFITQRWNLGCQMVYFQSKNPNSGKVCRVLQWKMLTNFIDIWSNLLPFRIFYDHLV